ncbi:MAG: hypothetical protein Q9160_007450 [Pyrenula sp. 1 TL-2023]
MTQDDALNPASPVEKRHSSSTASTKASQAESALEENKASAEASRWKRLYDRCTYTPKRCRYDPRAPVKLTTWLNILFANLYYAQPILNRLADEFNVSYEESSRIPTFAQAGYATGMAFICPLGDIVRRRPLTLYMDRAVRN